MSQTQAEGYSEGDLWEPGRLRTGLVQKNRVQRDNMGQQDLMRPGELGEGYNRASFRRRSTILTGELLRSMV